MKRDQNGYDQVSNRTPAFDNSHQHEMGRHSDEREKNNQAAAIFGDSVYRSEVHMIREIVPALDLMVVMELLHGNGYDLERTIDAALALMTSLSAEEGRAVLGDSPINNQNNQNNPNPSHVRMQPNRNINKEDFLPPSPFSTPSSSTVSRPFSFSKKVAVPLIEKNRKEGSARLSAFRGVPMILSEKFLAAPRFRLLINKHTNASTDFTIFFRRLSEKLGITIQENDGEIRIHTLHAKSPSEPLLALESGIKVGDILTGINSEYFSPGAEVQDIIDILHLTGTFVSLHFTRRHMFEDIQVQSYLTPHHKFARMLIDQTVISKERAGYVTKALKRLKERSMTWDGHLIAQRIEGWKLDSFMGGARHRNNSVLTPDRSLPPHMGGYNSPQTAGRTGGNGIDSANRAPASSSSSSSSIPCNRHLRPALSVRVIRAEERTDHVVYVIWVMDVRSGLEWFVRRRFREFYDFKDALVSIRPGISKMEFPPKRLNVAEIGAMVAERLSLLHRFLRRICSLICVNSLHPSTIRIQLVLQQFLDVPDRIENIHIVENKPTYHIGKFMVQVFVHNILQMSFMDKVLSGYIDTFNESSSTDDMKIWNDREGRKVLNSMKDFIDNLEIVLFDAIMEDCYDIMRKYSAENPYSPQTSVYTGGSSSMSKVQGSSSTVFEDIMTSTTGPISDPGSAASITVGLGSDPGCGLGSGDTRCYTSSTATTAMSTDMGDGDFILVDVDMAATSALKELNGENAENCVCGVSGVSGVREVSGAETEGEGPGVAGKTGDIGGGGIAFKQLDATKRGGCSSSSDQEIDDVAGVSLIWRKEVERGLQRTREKEHLQIIQQCNDDEVRFQIRSAVRRQVEIEIFVPCSARLRVILDRSFTVEESALKKNILKITHQPQSFFGIPTHQISPSSWDEVVFLMREIRYKTLPHDRLEALLLTAKEIPLYFLKEHPSSVQDNVTLGADDFLPIFIYILARAQIPDLMALSEELQALCDPDKRMSETGYYLATLEASLQHIIEANVTPESLVLFPDIMRVKVDDSDSDDSSAEGDEDDDGEEQDAEMKHVVIVHDPKV